ncbi:MAG: molybdopterin dinucleotide binding domain-containing protein, partial [Prolixibacteraceae bacterium]|nr:molybdopterin dinucleotide binding domain-containing protein [Prolixibacteraceae bacterium]
RPNQCVHSQFRHIDFLRKKEDEPSADVNPLDAQKRNINQNDLINILTPNGQIQMKANITDIIAPGKIRIAWGWGECEEKYNLNLLTDDNLKDSITSTTSNRLFMCSIEKVDNLL